MGKEFIMYKNIMWEPYKIFDYTGELEEFTLSPDTYLFVCNGGEGGMAPETEQRHNFGGTTYGILDLDHTQTFYACVGGNGENATKEEGHRSMGGYNGGGNGGLHLAGSTAWNGAGGGGGSDVRLFGGSGPYTDVHQIPDGYNELDYVEASNNNQYIDTGYIHKSNTKIEIVCDLTVNDKGYQALFGARTVESEKSMCFFVWMRGNNETCYAVGNSGRYYGPSFTFNQKVKVTAYNNICKWENMQGTELNRITNSYNNIDGAYSMYIMDYNQQNVPGQVRASGKLYSVKIWTGDRLERYLVPYANDDLTEVGMYDLVYNVKYLSATGTNFIPGNVVSEKTSYEYESADDYGLLTRIIVGAGGGGVGIQTSNNSYQDFLGWGGGPSGSYTTGSGSGDDQANKLWISATQETGFAFGIGGYAQDRTSGSWIGTYGDHGAAGGGGGWYGGYAIRGRQASNLDYDACAGAGGSSYVLTADSYKPTDYMAGFEDVMDSLYFRDYSLLPRQAFDGPSIIIYKQATNEPVVGDTLRIPYTGEGQDFKLIPGEYKLKCWGGDGAVRFRFNNRAKGGYAEGTLNLDAETIFSGRVGHSAAVIGVWIGSSIHDIWFDGKMTYNGNIGNYNGYRPAATTGGGATDIRLIPKPHKLPDEYDQVEYIESYSRQYIDTGHYFNASTTKYEFILYIPDPATVADPPPSWCTLFGENNETAGDFSTMYYFNFRESNVNRIGGGIRSDWVNYNSPITYDRKIRLVTTARGIFKWYDMDDNQLGSISIGNYSFTAPYSTILFGYNDGGTPHCSSYYRLYSFKVYENDILVRWYIPFRSKPDAEVEVTGLYDILNDVLYPNPRDEYPFLCGEVVEKTEYISDQESLLSRIIVAGGGGGQGDNDGYGGNGGGLSGGTYINGGNGTNNGPGTQTGTPAQSTGGGGGFGYNGLGRIYYDSHGGSGGNGWFGGNGTYDTGSSDDDKGGCGGSGYVLTESSYKPAGYIPDERYWLTDTVLTTGGNTVGGMTKIVIEPIRISAAAVIAQDQSSYKAYNKSIDTWESIEITDLTTEVFEEYGVSIGEIKSDEGLGTSYRLLVYDEYNLGLVGLNNHVIPNAQHVLFSELSTADVLSETYDCDVDDGTTVSVSHTISGAAERRAINVDICFDMNRVPIKNNIVYMVQFQTRNKPDSYYYYPGKPEYEPYNTALLYVGNSTDIPHRFKPYIGGFMPDGTTAISTVENVSSCEYKRNIYSVSLLNNSVLRFTRFNVMENKSYIIRDNVPKSALDGYVSGSLLVDDNYMYLIKSRIDDYWSPTKILRVPLNPDVAYTTYTSSTGGEWYGNCYGKAFWLDSETICTCSSQGFLKFNTRTLSFTSVKDNLDTGIGTRNEMVAGKYIILTYYYSTDCDGPRVYRKSNLTRVTPHSFTVVRGVKCACYDEENELFYMTQKGHLYIGKEYSDCSTELIADIITPYSTLTPKTIDYSNGIIYVTAVNSPTLFMYNISSDTWKSISLPFTQTDYGQTGQYRPTCFKGFFFIGQLKLFVTNFTALTKYRIGQKSNTILIQTNINTPVTYTYDERFVDIDESGISCHDGYMVKDLELIDSENSIYVSEYFNKTEDYKIMISYDLIIREEEEEDNEQE